MGRHFVDEERVCSLPRRGSYALAADEKRLYVVAWGGWSEWNGQQWAHHFGVPQLKGLPLMGLLPDGDRCGLPHKAGVCGLWNRASGELRWFDERHGLSDDWITSLAQVRGNLRGHIRRGDWLASTVRNGMPGGAAQRERDGRLSRCKRGLWGGA
jgi:hypothetical protein